MKKLFLTLLAVLCMTATLAQAQMATVTSSKTTTTHSSDLENTLVLQLKDGPVVIQMRPDLAPKHVARVKELVRQGFYDGLVFHRVIEGFMAQGGDPTGTGTGGSGQNIPAEFSPEPFVRGVVGAARSASPNSADSQFFIMFKEGSSLNGQYTVWGKVISGMEYVDKIQRGEPPMNPDKIIKATIAADTQKDSSAPVATTSESKTIITDDLKSAIKP